MKRRDALALGGDFKVCGLSLVISKRKQLQW